MRESRAVLLFSDDSALAELFYTTLSDDGFVVETCRRRDLLLERLRECEPSVLLLVMPAAPDEWPLAVLRALRAPTNAGSSSAPPVVLLTTDSASPVVLAALEFGMVTSVQLIPCDLADVTRAIEAARGQHAGSRETSVGGR